VGALVAVINTTMTNTFIQTVEADLTAAWGVIVGTVESDAAVLWGDFKSIFTAMLPAQYTVLQGLVVELITDVATGDIADIETALLNKAETEELAWIKSLGSATLQAVIGVIKAGAPK
jgi:hypothetical protein